jgi:flagellar hook-length control protein FliK
MILSPPRLGSVKVDLVMKDQVMHGKLLTESVAAREAVQSQLQGLKDHLQSQGIQVGELEVGVDSDSGGARPEADANPAKTVQNQSKESGESVAGEETPTAPKPTSSNDDQMIDLVA